MLANVEFELVLDVLGTCKYSVTINNFPTIIKPVFEEKQGRKC